MSTKESIVKGTFEDSDDRFRARLIEAIQAEVELMRADPDAYLVTPTKLETEGGWKVRGNEVWGSADGEYLLNSVCQFVSRVSGQPEVHVRDRWANVMEAGKGWYAAPHSHSNADVAVVYVLKPGEVSKDSPKGRFQFIDPRLPGCCPQPGYLSAALTPRMDEREVIAFPGFLTHWVSPYEGSTDRITLAFNVGFGPSPNRQKRNLEEPVDLGKRVVK